MRIRNQRGVAFPSPVAMLSVIAVAMAGIAYVATRGEEPTEREVTTVSQPADPSPSAEPTTKQRLPEGKRDKFEPKIVRGDTYIEVYNNSGITGLAGRVAEKAGDVGWQVVGTDNWVGLVPSSTVYYPARLQNEADLLALDLGIDRVMPAVGEMKLDRLTVVLTSDAA